MTSPPPSVSVITPSYNYAEFLDECLLSVQRQDGDVQHVVVDDGSSDHSWEIINRLHPDPSRDCRRQENRGLSATLNRCMELATGSWLLWLNADDFLMPGAVATLHRALELVPEADIVIGDSLFVDEQSRILRLRTPPPFDITLLRQGYNPLQTPAVFWRRSAMGDSRFDESMRLLMDLDMWLTVASAARKAVSVSAPLGAFRRHPRQESAASRPSDLEELRQIGRRHQLPGLAHASSGRHQGLSRYRHALRVAADRGHVRQLHVRRHRGRAADWTREAVLPDYLRARATPRLRVVDLRGSS